MTSNRVEDAGLCTKCGGLCCKRAPGRYSPAELETNGELTTGQVVTLLNAGYHAITTSFVTLFGTQAAALFHIAARGVGKPALSLCHNDMRCVYLDGNGCSQSLELRPFECAVMVPASSISRCSLPDGVSMEALWPSRQAVLREAIEAFSGNDWHTELLAQINDRKNQSEYARGARQLLNECSLASTALESDFVIGAWLD
jgi:Fe-S-cluster containining protein